MIAFFPYWKSPFCKAAVALRPAPGAAPADYARYGYLAYTSGDTLQAGKYLRQAVSALPNLTSPWLLLGDTMKSRLLIYGAFLRDLSHKKLPEQPVLTSDSLFYMNYAPKMQSWYGRKVIMSKSFKKRYDLNNKSN